MFGEMSFLEPGSLASASVVAATDVEICILDFQYPKFILHFFILFILLLFIVFILHFDVE
jgi:hypothetical protein